MSTATVVARSEWGRELFVPGASTWEPLADSFGIMAFYVMIVVSASFYVKKSIGQAAWRSIHFLAFGTFAAAAIHGVMAGTDPQHPVVLSMYVATVAIVALLLVVRISQEVAAPAAASRPARPAQRSGAAQVDHDRGVRPSAGVRARVETITNGEAAPAGKAPSAPIDMQDRVAALQARRAAKNGSPPAEAGAHVDPAIQDRLAALAARRAPSGGE